MASPGSDDELANCTPASQGDIGVFPTDWPGASRAGAQSPAAPLVPLAVVFCLGIAIAPALPFATSVWVGAALLGLALGAAGPWLGLGRLRWPALVLGFFCLGAHAIVVAERGAPPHHLSRVPEAALAGPLVAEGWVAVPPDPQPPDTRDSRDIQRTRFVIDVTQLTLDGLRVPATGRARLTVFGPPVEVRYGDSVRGTFRLRHPRRFENPGAFDYPAYLASQGVYLEGWTREPVEVSRAASGSRLLGAVFGVRTVLLQRLDAAMPPQQAGLLKATVLGDRSGLTPEMNRAFLDSGTYHILAISGLNVSLLAGALFGLFRLVRASPRWAAAAAALLVTFYAALAGAGASVVRAAVMADVFLLAVVLDRRADLLNSLALSGLALLWWNPRFLHDVGFQLTFLATLGIILAMPGWEARLVSLPRPVRWLLASMAITVAATATTLPVLAGSFHRLSPAGVVANIPIVPLSGLITGLGTAACAIFLVVPAGFSWLNQINGWLVDALFALARWFGAWPWSSVRVYAPTAGMLLCYYAALAAALWAWQPRPRHRVSRRIGRWTGVSALGFSVLLAAQVLWRLHPVVEDSLVRITMLDVGQGEAIHLSVPGRGHMLVDAGGMLGEGFDIGERVIVPFLWHAWVPQLDVLVLTHPQSDHVGGAPSILREVPVREVWSGGSPAVSATDVWIQEFLRQRRVPHRVVGAGDLPQRWGQVVMQVVHPPVEDGSAAPGRWGKKPKPNDESIVLRVQSGDQAMLLTGDLEREGEATLIGSGATVAAQVLKVPHHGSRQSSTEALLRAVRPEAALLSVGHRNPFRHPHPDVLARYQADGVRIWRTDRDGAISVEMRPGETRVWGRRGG